MISVWLRSSASFIFAVLFLTTSAAAEPGGQSLGSGLEAELAGYLKSYATVEHISAISLSVSLPNSTSNISIAAGTTEYGGGGMHVTPQNLYQIGSNTKAFTAVAILQLEAEGKLTIDQTVGKWLPQYPAWKNVSIRRLLDMTSDIPTYDDEPAMLAAYAANPTRYLTSPQLISFVYPKSKPNAGWLYSNTAYVLSEMIIERASKHSYAEEITSRFLRNSNLKLTSTYYDPHLYPAGVVNRMVAGYFYSRDSDNAPLAPLLGKDVRHMSLSWARGAGGIVSSPDDVARWSRALFVGPLLPAKQRRELTTLVSQKTGKEVSEATQEDSHTFGLGVAQLFVPDFGRVWFYEGETLGYRMTYAYLPKSDVVVAVGINSQPNKKEDHVGQLMSAIFHRLRSAGMI